MSINKMTADQKMNLLLLKDFIKSIDPINFDMGTYCEVESDNEIVMETLGDYVTEDDASYGGSLQLTPFLLQKLQEKTNPHTCGSHMCLMGWSYNVPALQAKLSKDSYKSWSDVSYELFGTDDSDSHGVGKYLFGVDWETGTTPEGNSTNTIEHALYRIDRVLAAVTDEDYKALRQEHRDLI